MRGAFRAGAERLWRDSFSRQIENVGLRLAPVEVVANVALRPGLGEGARLSPAVRAPHSDRTSTFCLPFAYQSTVGYDYAVLQCGYPTSVMTLNPRIQVPQPAYRRPESTQRRESRCTGRVHRKRSPGERVCAVYALRLPHARAILLRRLSGNAQHRLTRQECFEHLADAPAVDSEIVKTRWEVPHLEPGEEAWREHRARLEAHLPPHPGRAPSRGSVHRGRIDRCCRMPSP